VIEKRHLEELVDEAIDTGFPVRCSICGVAAVPDVMLLQGLANGEATASPYLVVRGDGRSARLYSVPVTPVVAP
jgi:hypothetical protein